MPSSRKTGRGRFSRLSSLVFSAVAALFVSWLFLSIVSGDDKVPQWPDTVADVAKTVSISELSAALTDRSEEKRIAILGDRIFVELKAGAGDAVPDKDKIGPDGEIDDVIVADMPQPSAYFIGQFISELDLMKSPHRLEFFTAHDGIGLAGLLNLVFQAIFLGVMVYFIMNLSGRGSGGMFGTEKGFEMIEAKDLATGLSSVAGLENARHEVEEIIALLKDDGAAGMAGGRLPRGLLLDGPPGTGKTLIARAMAKEAGVGFIRVDASSLSQMFVGLGAMKVRKLFRLARKHAPCIVFIDEIDAVGKARGAGRNGEQEKDNTLNALLTELDGFEAREGIFLIAATNRPDVLDPALTRPGRVDRRITLHLPDIRARQEILAVHCRDKQLAEDVDLKSIAATAYRMSGADLENLVNEAALLAGRAGRATIAMADFVEARDRHLLPQSGGKIDMMSDERQITAIHEAGHAVAAILLPDADPVDKVTIAPRGGALGYVLQTPGRDRVFETKCRLEARLAVTTAGRVAEAIFFGNDRITTGAASDIRQATEIAKAMVMSYGMSKLGFLAIDPEDPVFFMQKNAVNAEVSTLIDAAQAKTQWLLEENRDAIAHLAEALIAQETLSGDMAREIVQSAMTKQQVMTDQSPVSAPAPEMA